MLLHNQRAPNGSLDHGLPRRIYRQSVEIAGLASMSRFPDDFPKHMIPVFHQVSHTGSREVYFFAAGDPHYPASRSRFHQALGAGTPDCGRSKRRRVNPRRETLLQKSEEGLAEGKALLQAMLERQAVRRPRREVKGCEKKMEGHRKLEREQRQEMREDMQKQHEQFSGIINSNCSCFFHSY